MEYFASPYVDYPDALFSSGIVQSFLASGADLSPVNISQYKPERALILDSSFNPPTLAHQAIVVNALRKLGLEHTFLGLLLSVNNADKPAKPASFAERMSMMYLLGCEIEGQGAEERPPPIHASKGRPILSIWTILTTKAYFHEKSAALSANLEAQKLGHLEQIFLVGFDTLVRIFNPRYYGAATTHPTAPQNDEGETGKDNGDGRPSPMQEALDPFFRRARLLVTLRWDGKSGAMEAQHAYIKDAAEGNIPGVRGWWGERIEVVEATEFEEEVSSTAAREAAREEDWDRLRKLVPPSIMFHIQKTNPYKQEPPASGA